MKTAINYIGDHLPNCPDFPRFNMATSPPTAAKPQAEVIILSEPFNAKFDEV
jgi:hypothetical protein